MKKNSYCYFVLLGIMAGIFSGCQWLTPLPAVKGQMSYFIGVDISGSFRKTPEFGDALDFLAYYIYGHRQGLHNLKKPKALFLGAIGGNYEDDPQSFHTLFDVENKSVAEIRANLGEWFSGKNILTDYNSFFQSIARLAKKRNLTLSPITIIIISDGIPVGTEVERGKASKKSYSRIDVSPVEYLARNVTLRLLYLSPKAAKNWEDYVPHQRLRLWTAPSAVMRGWRQHLNPQANDDQQDPLYEWMQYNVDFRVRSQAL